MRQLEEEEKKGPYWFLFFFLPVLFMKWPVGLMVWWKLLNMDEISLAQLSAERVSQNNCQMTGSSENVKNEKKLCWIQLSTVRLLSGRAKIRRLATQSMMWERAAASRWHHVYKGTALISHFYWWRENLLFYTAHWHTTTWHVPLSFFSYQETDFWPVVICDLRARSSRAK